MSDRPTLSGWDIRHYRLREGDCNRLRRDLGLSARGYAVLDALVGHDLPQRGEGTSYRKGVVWPSVARLAALCACSERTVQRGLAELIALSLVRRIVCGRGRTAQFVIAWDELCPGGVAPVKGDSHAVPRPARRSRSGREERETASASAPCPIGPPPRRSFWQEEIPHDERTRQLVAHIRRALTGEAALGR